MEFLRIVIQFLDTQMTTPTSFGWFHLLFIALSIAAAVLLCVTHKTGDDARVRRVVLTAALLTVVLEIYKQFNYTFEWGENGLEIDYQWYTFPWQFCSIPMYVGTLTAFFKKGRVHDALCAFLATYAIFAGACVMVYPGDVFTGTIGINIQTMICHGSMITVGVYLWYSGYVKAVHKTILKALCVFAAALGIAVIMNEIAYVGGLLETDSFNMFYVSPHCDPHLPVYSLVQQVVPYPWCLFIYIAGFTAAAYVIVLAVMGIKRIARKVKKQA